MVATTVSLVVVAASFWVLASTSAIIADGSPGRTKKCETDVLEDVIGC